MRSLTTLLTLLALTALLAGCLEVPDEDANRETEIRSFELSGDRNDDDRLEIHPNQAFAVTLRVRSNIFWSGALYVSEDAQLTAADEERNALLVGCGVSSGDCSDISCEFGYDGRDNTLACGLGGPSSSSRAAELGDFLQQYGQDAYLILRVCGTDAEDGSSGVLKDCVTAAQPVTFY